ncbi:MAG: von Willebrand factor type A domain-containing protein, partial [Oscillospiraceae bacterium]|nr:von Willebrand factor type A domain-containing protein [Oscillospiraceae bacterium]
MKKQILAFLMAAMIFVVSFSAFAYPDVQPDTPYQTAINSLSAEGLLEGFPDGTFKPDSEITRAEFCKIVMTVFGNEAAAGKSYNAVSFTDIDTHWAKEYIIAAANMGYVNGIGNGLFAPDEKITCEQAIAIIVRIVSGDKRSYPFDYLAYAMDEEISSGVPLVTGRNITRGETAQLIYNVLESRKFEEQERAYLAALRKEEEENVGSMPMPSSPPMLPQISEEAPPGSVPLPDVSAPMLEYDPSGPPPMGDSYYPGTEEYLTNDENGFKSPVTSPLSTFSLDVNTASYSLVRGLL